MYQKKFQINNLIMWGDEMNNRIITIGRQYGSRGRLIAREVAKQLNVPCYDKELLTICAKESGINPEAFACNDEKLANSFYYVARNMSSEYNIPINHKLLLTQLETIKMLAEKESCVFVGRCADYALRDFDNCLNVFVYGDIEYRAKNAVESYGLESKNPIKDVKKKDKQRANYYNFYTTKEWGKLSSYDLCVDSGKLGIEKTIDIIVKAY